MFITSCHKISNSDANIYGFPVSTVKVFGQIRKSATKIGSQTWSSNKGIRSNLRSRQMSMDRENVKMNKMDDTEKVE